MMRYQQRSSRKRERDPDDDERLFFLGMTRRSQLGMSCDCDLVKRLEADIDAARKKPFFSFLSFFASGSKNPFACSLFPCVLLKRYAQPNPDTAILCGFVSETSRLPLTFVIFIFIFILIFSLDSLSLATVSIRPLLVSYR